MEGAVVTSPTLCGEEQDSPHMIYCRAGLERNKTKVSNCSVPTSPSPSAGLNVLFVLCSLRHSGMCHGLDIFHSLGCMG
jgi:hypothetical protein